MLNKVRIPFLTTIIVSTVNVICTILLRGNFFAWFLIFALVACLAIREVIHALKNHRNRTLNIKPDKHVLIAWSISVFVCTTLFLNAFYLQPGLYSNNASNLKKRDLLMTQYFQGEDNFSHISIAEVINIRNESTYFDGKTSKGNMILPDLLGYAEGPQSAVSVVKSLFHATTSIAGKQESNFTYLITSYLFVHFLMGGMLIGLLTTLVLKLLNRLYNLNFATISIVTILATTTYMRYTLFPLLDVGFFSQSAGLIAIFATVYLETSKEFLEYSKIKPTISLILRLILLIITGNTWWILLPVLLPIFCLRQSLIWFRYIKNKNFGVLILNLFITLVGAVLTGIPMFIQIVVLKTDISLFANTPGGILPIEVGKILFVLSVLLAILLFLIFLTKKSFAKQPNSLVITASFTLSFLFYVSAFAIFQQVTKETFSYYAFKLTWSLSWLIPFLVILIIGIITIKICCIKKVMSFSRPLFQISSLIIICVSSIFFYSSLKIHNVNLKNSSNLELLANFSKAIDLAEADGKTLVIVSDCNKITDYYFQRAATSSQASIPPQILNYLLSTLKTEQLNRDFIQSELISSFADKIFLLDISPTVDDNAPSDRLKLMNVKYNRTTVFELDQSSALSNLCTNEQLASIP